MLLERRLAKKHATGSSNKSRENESSSEKRFKGSTKFASWLSSKISTNNTSTTMWDHSLATTGALPDPHPHTTILQVNVDVELGTITETAGEEEMDITRGQAQSGRSRVLSIDGRREGWLAPSSSTTTTTTTAGQKPSRGMHGKSDWRLGGRNMAPNSGVIYVGESGGPQWDFIWDGRRTAFTETRLQELRHQRPP